MTWIVPVIGGTYAITSIFFTKFPQYLPNLITNRPNWKKSRSLFPNCVHISHRGGCGESYENTLKAFQNAKNLGTEMMELDVHLTNDDIVVVSHDQNLARVTGRSLNIKECDFNELPKIQDQVPIDFEYKTIYQSSDKSEEHVAIPTLESVFENFPNLSINIDIKTYDETLIDKVNDLIIKYDREKLTVWGNFFDKTTQKCYQTNPNIGLLFSVKRVVQLLVYFYLGILPYVTFQETHLEIPMPILAYKRYGQDMTWKHKLVANLADFLLMRKSLFEHLDYRGIKTYMWVLNSEEDFDRAFKDLKVTGVMTDYPTLLTNYLTKNPQILKKNE